MKPKFLSPLEVRLIGYQSFELLTPLTFENTKFVITVYPGFDYDGASIPEALWSFVGCPMGGLYSAAACIHDALYASKLFDRKTCDKLFYEAMMASKVDKALAKRMYLAVRVFGASAYEDADDLSKYRNLVKIDLK